MKRWITVLTLSVIFAAACNTGKKENAGEPGDTSMNKPTVLDIVKDNHYLWEITEDSSGNPKLVRSTAVEEDSLSVPFVIDRLNSRYPDIRLEFNRISGDTIFVRIANSKKLNSEMGSTGAENYMAEVTYNLSELRNINCVFFDFKKGEHAEPGSYTKTDFVYLLK